MKYLVILAILGVAAAAPQRGLFQGAGQLVQNAAKLVLDPKEAQILRYDSDNDGLGSYSFGFEQSDGQKREEQGVLNNPNTDNESLAVQGSYSWVGPDGVTYLVKYTADEEGYKPQIEQGPGGGVPPGVVASLLG